MKTGRRAFLQAAGTVSAVAAVAVKPLGVLAAGHTELRRSHFAPLVGQQFSVAQAPAGLTLLALHALPHTGEIERSFRIVFEVQGEGRLAQDTWQISHPALGSHAVFLSPNDAQGRLVEAVFNRG